MTPYQIARLVLGVAFFSLAAYRLFGRHLRRRWVNGVEVKK